VSLDYPDYHAHLAHVASQRREAMTERTEVAELLCPWCDQDQVAEADRLLATARGAWILFTDGSRHFEPSGDTVVHWDSQEPDDEDPCYCQNCDWEGTPGQLADPRLPRWEVTIADADDDDRALHTRTVRAADRDAAVEHHIVAQIVATERREYPNAMVHRVVALDED
jgi:hypothetical protein